MGLTGRLTGRMYTAPPNPWVAFGFLVVSVISAVVLVYHLKPWIESQFWPAVPLKAVSFDLGMSSGGRSSFADYYPRGVYLFDRDGVEYKAVHVYPSSRATYSRAYARRELDRVMLAKVAYVDPTDPKRAVLFRMPNRGLMWVLCLWSSLFAAGVLYVLAYIDQLRGRQLEGWVVTVYAPITAFFGFLTLIAADVVDLSIPWQIPAPTIVASCLVGIFGVVLILVRAVVGLGRMMRVPPEPADTPGM